MHPNDQENTAFITEIVVYYYKVMPLRLKNAEATFQRLVNQRFTENLEKTIKVYIDDMLVKSLKAEDHIEHWTNCFKLIIEYCMRLNAKKCI